MLSYFKRLDWGVTVPVLVMTAVSLTMVASIAPRLFPMQLAWFGIGIAVAVLLGVSDIRSLTNHRAVVYGLYMLAIGLLLATALFAPTIRGSRSWLSFGHAQFQASEFAKVALIVLFSYFFAKGHARIAHGSTILVSFLYLALPAAFVMKQPDLGSALIMGGVWIGYLFASGIKPRHVGLGLIVAVVGFIIAWNGFLKPYQKERIVGLFVPDRDPLGVNYNVIQAKIAIGSGGFFGKGFRQGTQVQLGFLPEAQTDFILAALIEEWGLVGAIILFGAFLSLMLRIIWIALESPNNFSRLLCLGAIILYLLHFVVNVGSNVGLLPVIGVSFPFLSYGGSNLLANFMLIGIIQSIAARKSF
ncbi:MAG: FtsW/RodA/SpoVE family cell cycle protein [bacterium]|nr:FtsW/RodA/SpoVE family cell cycle protein [bacterium]